MPKPTRYTYDELRIRVGKGYYSTKLEYPSSSNPYIKLKEPTTPEEVDAYAERLKKSLNWKAEYQDLRDKYLADVSRLRKLFSEDLINSFFYSRSSQRQQEIMSFITNKAETFVDQLELADELHDLFLA